ncbi:ribonucleotide-diphosphate reductase subunit beta [Salinirubrum litoreum]|uniref:Ribonucleotide-diphosphate reductase subunit beta n=1 Tax=Salinirubrum litoreum TaxID=1126234 RepID=A0ABD5R8T7_9EURY|nr:ribonucleotide-diphosphate reductase subunit beta [Salinirubrum litoreum]
MSGQMQIDDRSRSQRYYRHAVENHWDPHDIDLSADAGPLSAVDDEVFDQLRLFLARFGAGEQAVTEDLSPLAVRADDPADSMFITSQLYEEAKHLDFFDRYWREVIHPVEDARGVERSYPTEDRWFNDDYVDLFDRNEQAMHRLLDDDSAENRVRAFCHYHLTIEGILAQTGYYIMSACYDDSEYTRLPTLPGLVAGVTQIRGDEGRHVGFGMTKLKDLLEDGADPQIIHDTVNELMPMVHGIVTTVTGDFGPADSEFVEYATEKHLQRMQQITNATAEIPNVERLVALDD